MLVMGDEDTSVVTRARNKLSILHRNYQFYLDRTTPHSFHRWLTTAVLFIIFSLRVIMAQGYFVVAYALCIYLLNLLLLFLSPRFDPTGELFGVPDESEDGAPISNIQGLNPDLAPGAALLPTGRDDEFRPFVRRLPEFRCWHNSTRAILVAIFCSMFSVFDLPVFWPILLFYFVTLTIVTLRRQISHMIKYKYVPFDFGKKVYTPAS